MTDNMQDITQAVKDLIAERDRYKAALEKYADDLNWQGDEYDDIWAPGMEHGYNIARKALKGSAE